MHVLIQQSLLSQAIQAVASVIEPRGDNWIRVHMHENSLEFYAEGAYACCSVNLSGVRCLGPEGSVAVRGDILRSLIDLFPASAIIELEKQGPRLAIHMGTTSASLPTLERIGDNALRDALSLPASIWQGEVDFGRLTESLALTKWATSKPKQAKEGETQDAGQAVNTAVFLGAENGILTAWTFNSSYTTRVRLPIATAEHEVDTSVKHVAVPARRFTEALTGISVSEASDTRATLRATATALQVAFCQAVEHGVSYSVDLVVKGIQVTAPPVRAVERYFVPTEDLFVVAASTLSDRLKKLLALTGAYSFPACEVKESLTLKIPIKKKEITEVIAVEKGVENAINLRLPMTLIQLAKVSSGISLGFALVEQALVVSCKKEGLNVQALWVIPR